MCFARDHASTRRNANSAWVLGLIAGFAWAEAPVARAEAVSPADSLFAPVAAQQAERLERIARLGSGSLTTDDVLTLLEAGRVDDAKAALPSVTGSERRVAGLRLRIALTRQDFAVAKPLVDAIAARPDPTERERALRFIYLFAVDDGAQVDRLTRDPPPAPGTTAPLADLIAAGRLAYNLLNYDRAESCFTRAIERTEAAHDSGFARSARAAALRGMGQVLSQRRDYDGSLVRLREALALDATPELLGALSETLIRLGRTDEAITSAEWGVRLNPYQDAAHYLLGNGYARKNYTQLFAAYPAAFADGDGRRGLADADSQLAAGHRDAARDAYTRLHRAHPAWVDAMVRLASLDFEDGRYADTRDLCFEALRTCPEYGRAHATLAKAIEFQRLAVDVHRADYERRFADAPMPVVPGIERFVVNWKSLSPRHQKRVALSVAPWKPFIPVLIEGGSSYYIKPLYMLLSETPGLATMRDARIDYDSRLWDDVRGAGGFNTVTGIEDVERTIFDRYNTVLHELTHQVHGVLTADQSREIQELYRRAKQRDDATRNGFLSRYAGGSVYEYFAEGANALGSPRRDAYDPREVVRERLDAIDPDLRRLVERTMAITDVSASYPVAYTNAGDDRLDRGEVDAALTYYDRALERNPKEETALASRTRASTLKGDRAGAVATAGKALAAYPASGKVVTFAASARWYGGMGIDSSIALLERARPVVRGEDTHEVDLALGNLYWTRGDGARAAGAFDSVLAYQSDNPEALWGKGAALALRRDWAHAFGYYDRAVRMRTGIAALRCDYARDLLRAGRLKEARAQLDAAALLDRELPTAEALRAWWWLDSGRADSARIHAQRALAWGAWCDLARIVLGRAETKLGSDVAAAAAWAPVRERIAQQAPPEYVYRKSLSQWVSVHELPAVERQLMAAASPPIRRGATRTPPSPPTSRPGADTGR